MVDIKKCVSYNIELYPNEPICDNKESIAALFTLLGLTNGEDDMPRVKKLMIYEAIRQNGLTNDEAHNAFWKAYGDPYLPSGQIEFRHLMKYVTEMRESPNNKLYSYEYVLEQTSKGVPMETFEITETTGSNGKKLWRKVV